MKSIYEKIIIVLILGFVIQVVLAGVFYRQVALKKVIVEINAQEDKRRSIMEEATIAAQKLSIRAERAEKTLDALSQKNSVGIIIKNLDGETLYSSKKFINENTIQQQDYIKTGGKISSIVYGYFPAKINLEPNIKQTRIRLLTMIVILAVSLSTLFIIYKTLAEPLKKLSKSVSEINYGSTLVKIPYYGDDELGMLCRNFENMGERLKKSEKTQQELIQAISHDIKTPLTSIIGYSKRLLDHKVSEDKINEYYSTINRKANDLKFLLEELDEYSYLNLETKYDMNTVLCEKYIEEVFSELKKEVEQKNGEFYYTIKLKQNARINIDNMKMKRVYNNIIENSIKYSEGKCIINASASMENNLVRIDLWDNGIGVPKEQLANIFDRFYRVDTSRSREKGGIGLGLSICKDIIENHGGKIYCKSEPNCGLHIWFTLPEVS